MTEVKLDYELEFCKGTVGFVSVKEMPQPDQYDNTHRASFTIQGANKSGDPKADKDSIFFSVGTIKGDTITAKDADGNWKEVKKGAVIKFPFKVNGDWVNVSRSKITVLEEAPAQPVKQPSGGDKSQSPASKGYAKKKYNDTGMRTGHIQTCTEYLLGTKTYKNGKPTEQAVKVAQEVEQANERVKAFLKAQRPETSDYDLGASAGRAMKEGCNHEKTVKAAEEYAMAAVSNESHNLFESIVKGTYGEESQANHHDVPEAQNESGKKVEDPEIDYDDSIPF